MEALLARIVVSSRLTAVSSFTAVPTSPVSRSCERRSLFSARSRAFSPFDCASCKWHCASCKWQGYIKGTSMHALERCKWVGSIYVQSKAGAIKQVPDLFDHAEFRGMHGREDNCQRDKGLPETRSRQTVDPVRTC